MIKIYTDGSCIENPGKGGWAAIILNDGNKTEIKGNKTMKLTYTQRIRKEFKRNHRKLNEV